ncbi:hypothetical protein HDU99_006147, partial [Rhizoclosmatium hyalinum]
MILETVTASIANLAKTLGTTPRNLGLALALSLASVVTIRAFAFPARRRGKKIPGPVGYPFVGSVPDLGGAASSGKQHEYFLHVNNTYGRVARIPLPNVNIILVSDPVLVHRALTDTVDFYRDDFVQKSLGVFVKDALFVFPSGDTWKRHRKYLQPAFAPPQLRYAFQVATNHASALGNYWESKINGSSDQYIVADLFHTFTSLTLDVIGQTAFSYEFHAVENYHAGKDTELHLVLQDLALLFQEVR